MSPRENNKGIKMFELESSPVQFHQQNHANSLGVKGSF